MTTISANIIKDSISSEGIRITTVHLRYPRFIHAELMTHRVFSRNARSSRAVPVKTMLEEIRNDPVVPMFWGKNQKGMQADIECNAPVFDHDDLNNVGMSFPRTREEAWLDARDYAVKTAERFDDAGYHKQVVNRLLEPFMHIDTLVTSTDWKNFFHLRNHKDAEPHFQLLAQVTKNAMDESSLQVLQEGQWHLPYVDQNDINIAHEYFQHVHRKIPSRNEINELLCKISSARCARISYKPFDGNADIDSELSRFEKLVGNPVHASPMEHQAKPATRNTDGSWHDSECFGNLRGYIQFRKTIPYEAINEEE